jgi:hypothetical protein
MAVINIPRRYLIRFRTIDGKEFEYSIVSWFGRDKAVAWVAGVHDTPRPEDSIYQVEVQDLGEPELGPQGYSLEPDEYTDRMEW